MESLRTVLLKEQEKQGFVFAEDVYGREIENIFNN
jgi:pyridoxine/pyridoxamine 5'-phosphate oxidase